MAEIIIDVKPSGTASAYVNAPFDVAKETLENAGYSVISLQRNAKLRMQEGSQANVSQYGNWTREGVIYVPNKGKFLTKNSPIMANSKKATQCHRNGKEFYLTPEQVEQALADSVELSVKALPTDRFGEDEITAYAFGEDAKKYGEFLKENAIDSMPIWTADIQDKAFARQMWFHRLDISSELGGGRGLGCSGRVRGVQDGAEGTAPKNSGVEAYTPAQMEKALNELGFSGVSKGLVAKLRNK